MEQILQTYWFPSEFKKLYVFHHFYNPEAFITCLIWFYSVLNMDSLFDLWKLALKDL